MNEGNYTDISDSIWKDEAFPHFFRNGDYIAPLEEAKTERSQAEKNQFTR